MGKRLTGRQEKFYSYIFFVIFINTHYEVPLSVHATFRMHSPYDQ